jgi:hypothetical protein
VVLLKSQFHNGESQLAIVRTSGGAIVDLERHQPLELLADRKWETIRDWLA